MLSTSFTWVGLLASVLLRWADAEGGRGGSRRVASAAIAVFTWSVPIPAFLLIGAARSYDAAGAWGVLRATGVFALFVGLLWVTARYSGPVRRRTRT